MSPATVGNRTDRVVVVGAGLGGLSAAMHLAAAGRSVTVLERADVPGGRAGRVTVPVEGGCYRLDTGPTVLTMPELIRDCFEALDEELTDWLRLLPVEPAYRAHFADGSRLDVHTNPEAMAAEIEAVCGPDEAAGYRRYVRYLSRLYRYEMRDFIDRNTDSPLDLLTVNLARIAAIGGFGRLAGRVARYLHDPRTQRVFSFQSMYAGLSPYRALALYAVIAYMDSVSGVYVPVGGMHAVPVAMAAAASKHGVQFRYGCTVTKVELHGQRAVAVHTADGDRLPCDAVVLNPDLPVAYRDLLGVRPRRPVPVRYSPSCFLLLAGSRTRYRAAVQHNLHFGRAWQEVFEELDHGRLMTDPSLLVTQPTYSDPGLAPSGRHVYSVLLPTPNLSAGLDWERLRPRYREHVLSTLADRGYPGFEDGIEVELVTTPADWAAQGMAAGTPFAAAHTFAQTGPFRPGNRWGDNVAFAGSGTRPGVGVPMVLISGRLAAERVVGPVSGYRSRAWH